MTMGFEPLAHPLVPCPVCGFMKVPTASCPGCEAWEIYRVECTNHPNKNAVRLCDSCDHPFCKDCLCRNRLGFFYCQNCYPALFKNNLQPKCEIPIDENGLKRIQSKIQFEFNKNEESIDDKISWVNMLADYVGGKSRMYTWSGVVIGGIIGSVLALRLGEAIGKEWLPLLNLTIILAISGAMADIRDYDGVKVIFLSMIIGTIVLFFGILGLDRGVMGIFASVVAGLFFSAGMGAFYGFGGVVCKEIGKSIAGAKSGAIAGAIIGFFGGVLILLTIGYLPSFLTTIHTGGLIADIIGLINHIFEFLGKLILGFLFTLGAPIPFFIVPIFAFIGYAIGTILGDRYERIANENLMK